MQIASTGHPHTQGSLFKQNGHTWLYMILSHSEGTWNIFSSRSRRKDILLGSRRQPDRRVLLVGAPSDW